MIAQTYDGFFNSSMCDYGKRKVICDRLAFLVSSNTMPAEK
jgi:hypothetical protein